MLLMTLRLENCRKVELMNKVLTKLLRMFRGSTSGGKICELISRASIIGPFKCGTGLGIRWVKPTSSQMYTSSRMPSWTCLMSSLMRILPR